MRVLTAHKQEIDKNTKSYNRDYNCLIRVTKKCHDDVKEARLLMASYKTRFDQGSGVSDGAHCKG